MSISVTGYLLWAKRDYFFFYGIFIIEFNFLIKISEVFTISIFAKSATFITLSPELHFWALAVLSVF